MSSRFIDAHRQPANLAALSPNVCSPPIADIGSHLQHANMTWNSVEQRIQQLGPGAEQCGNLSDLIAALTAATPPREVSKNAYNDGISFHWEGFEIETHADRFETYQFSERETVIQHWSHVPGTTISAELLNQVKSATS